MLVAALAVGLLAAYFLGLKAGIAAAGASAVLFFLADVVPGMKILAYVIVGVAVAVMCFAKPKTQGITPASAVKRARQVIDRVRKRTKL